MEKKGKSQRYRYIYLLHKMAAMFIADDPHQEDRRRRRRRHRHHHYHQVDGATIYPTTTTATARNPLVYN